MYKSGGALGVQMLNSATTLIQRDNQGGSPMQTMYYIGLDVHKKKISYCVKDGSGHIHAEGAIPAARSDLDRWMKTLPAPWTAAMEATIFTGWIYDHRHEVRRADDGLLIPNLVMEELPTIRGLIVTSAF